MHQKIKRKKKNTLLSHENITIHQKMKKESIMQIAHFHTKFSAPKRFCSVAPQINVLYTLRARAQDLPSTYIKPAVDSTNDGV